MITRIIGMDVGLSGGIAILARSASTPRIWRASAFSMPTFEELSPVKRGKKRKMINDYDVRSIAAIVQQIVAAGLNDGGVTHACIERQRPLIAKGAAMNIETSRITAMRLGRGQGILEGICHASGCQRVDLVYPQSWQNRILGSPNQRKHVHTMDGQRASTKVLAVAMAPSLYPEVSYLRTLRSKRLHDGMCDAMLIAEYKRRFVVEQEETTTLPIPSVRTGGGGTLHDGNRGKNGQHGWLHSGRDIRKPLPAGLRHASDSP